MGGRETTRGILLQAIACLLGALQSDNTWTSLTLEPDLDAEKVDIAWRCPDGIKVTQVKSSRNQLNVPDAKKWAKELEDSCEATSYELILIGPCSDELSRGQRYGSVEVPSPKPLDIQGLIEQSAHRLAVYLEYQGKPAGEAITRENVVDSLVGRMQRFSTEGKPVLRNDFELLLDKWVQDALAKEEKPSLEQLRVLKERIDKQVEKLPYIKTLHIDHPDAIQWRGAIERYMRKLDETLPGDNFEKQRADIPWHEPNMRATDEDYRRGCDMTKGLLGDALQKLQEELDMMQEGAA
jgi:hypothetical protein